MINTSTLLKIIAKVKKVEENIANINEARSQIIIKNDS